MSTKNKFNLGSILGLTPSSEKKADQEHQQKLDEMRSEKQQEGNDSPDENRKVVMHGAKLLCKYAPAPGSLLVTSNQIMLQDKFWATEGDHGKMNLQFQGLCLHSKWGYNKPPCLSVISPVKWENVGSAMVQGKKVLLKGSTIQCAISNEKIKIIFDGQTCSPSSISSSEMDVCTIK